MREDFLFPQVPTRALADKDLENLIDVIDKHDLQPYIEAELQRIRKNELWQWGKKYFFNEDETAWEMSPGELAIFRLIVLREYPRSQIVSSTQYGKTLTVARGILARISTFPEPWLVVVPDLKRGRVLLNYIIQDTARNEYFKNKLVGINLKEKSALERLLEERSKVRLTYQIISNDRIPRYGSIELLTSEARRTVNTITTIMGFGGRNVVADESALESDDIETGIFRMLAGRGEDTFYLKIGNPFFRNHFLKTWKDKRYKKVFINYVIGLLEGRYTESFIEEARERPQFNVLFETRFPSSEGEDAQGWKPLISEDEVRLAMQGGVHFGEERLGGDPADTGECESVLVKRSTGLAEVMFRSDSVDIMDFVGQTLMILKNFINSLRFYGDKVGVGAGYLARLKQLRDQENHKWEIKGVNAGEKIDEKLEGLEEKKSFANKKAQMFWRAREWIKAGGKLSKDEIWLQLCNIKYTADSQGRITIMPKKEMLKLGYPSPDVADALSFTFYDKPKLYLSDREKIQEEMGEEESFNKFSLFPNIG